MEKKKKKIAEQRQRTTSVAPAHQGAQSAEAEGAEIQADRRHAGGGNPDTVVPAQPGSSRCEHPHPSAAVDRPDPGRPQDA
eukprot:1258318-Prymnesium_polylepis.1